MLSCSPSLNLIEWLWKFMRTTILYNRYYEKFADFNADVMRFFNNIGKYVDKLSTLLAKKFQIPEYKNQKLICVKYK